LFKEISVIYTPCSTNAPDYFVDPISNILTILGFAESTIAMISLLRDISFLFKYSNFIPEYLGCDTTFP